MSFQHDINIFFINFKCLRNLKPKKCQIKGFDLNGNKNQTHQRRVVAWMSSADFSGVRLSGVNFQFDTWKMSHAAPCIQINFIRYIHVTFKPKIQPTAKVTFKSCVQRVRTPPPRVVRHKKKLRRKNKKVINHPKPQGGSCPTQQSTQTDRFLRPQM